MGFGRYEVHPRHMLEGHSRSPAAAFGSPGGAGLGFNVLGLWLKFSGFGYGDKGLEAWV